MSMTFEQMSEAVRDAERTLNRAKYMVKKMAPLVAGQLEHGDIDHWTLAKMKRELANYNIHTRRWKK